jgi:hypothetical protein
MSIEVHRRMGGFNWERPSDSLHQRRNRDCHRYFNSKYTAF